MHLLQNFHRQLCNISPISRTRMIPFQDLMPAIGRYINKLPKKESIEKTFERIATDLFGSTVQIGTIKISYSSYFVSETEIQCELGHFFRYYVKKRACMYRVM